MCRDAQEDIATGRIASDDILQSVRSPDRVSIGKTSVSVHVCVLQFTQPFYYQYFQIVDLMLVP